MTDRRELQEELERLVAANAASKGWGAAVGARSERIKEIEREIGRKVAAELQEMNPAMSGKKIIDGLKDALAGNFSAVTIEGQRWVRVDAQCAPDQEALQAAWAEGYEFGLNSRDKTPGAAALRALVIEECAKVCEDLRHDDYSAETSDWSGGTFDCARAIRALALSEGSR